MDEELLARRERIYEELGVKLDGEQSLSLYALLNVAEGESDARLISKAYRKQAKALLKKKARKDRPVVDAIQEEVEYAFGVLKDDERRARYDGFLKLERRREGRVQLRFAADLAAEDGRISPAAYAKLEARCREMGDLVEGQPWVKGWLAEAGLTVAERPAAAPPAMPAPPPPREPTPAERILDLLRFSVREGRVRHEAALKLLAFAAELGLSAEALRREADGVARGEGWTIEWEPTVKRLRPPSTRLSVEAEPTRSPRPLSPEAPPPLERPRLVPERREPSPSGRLLAAPRSGVARPLPTRAPGEGSGRHRRPSEVNSRLALLYEEATRAVRKAVLAHGDLRAYVPSPQRGSELVPRIGGRSVEDVFREEVEALTEALAALAKMRVGAEGVSGEVRVHVEALEDELRGYLETAQELDDAVMQGLDAEGELRAWRRYVAAKRSASLAETPPAALQPPPSAAPFPDPASQRVDGRRPSGPQETSSRVISLGKLELDEEPAPRAPLPSPRRVTPGPEPSSRRSRRRPTQPPPVSPPAPAPARRSIPLRRRTESERQRVVEMPRLRESGRSEARRLVSVPLAAELASGRRRVLAGIELGSRCRVAIFGEDGQPRLISNASGDVETPATLLFNEYSLLVGRSAREALPDAPEHRVEGYLARIGDPGWSHEAYGRRYPAEVLVSLLLSRLVRDVLVATGESVTDVVLAIPGYLNGSQRASLRVAGAMAGVSVLDIVDSASVVGLVPFDAALEAGRGVQLAVHVGGESLDVAMLEFQGGQRLIRQVAAEPSLGQQSWNERLAREVADRFASLEDLDPWADPLCRADLRHKAWLAARELASNDPARILVECQDRIRMLSLSRGRFDELSAGSMERSRELVTQLLRDGQTSTTQLDRVELSGDEVLRPYLRRMLVEAFGRKVHQRPKAQAAAGALVWGSWRLCRLTQQEGPGRPDDLRSSEALEAVAPSALRRGFERIALRRTTRESVGVLTEGAAGPKALLLAPAGSPAAGALRRQVSVIGPGLASSGALPRRGEDVIVTLVGDDASEVLAELKVPDPHGILASVELELRFQEQDGRYIVDVRDPAGGDLLLSQDVRPESRRGVMAEPQAEQWRRDLRRLFDEGPASLQRS